MICDVCNRPDREVIGVASTSIPYSCSFCQECAEERADPVFVFEFWYTEIGSPDNHRFPDHARTFFQPMGKYITYREWHAIRERDPDAHVLDFHLTKMSEALGDDNPERTGGGDEEDREPPPQREGEAPEGAGPPQEAALRGAAQQAAPAPSPPDEAPRPGGGES